MWHMYVTSPPLRLHQRHPVGLPHPDQEARVNGTHQGLKNSKLNQSKLEKPRNHKETGLNQNKLDQLGGIDLPKIWTKYSSPIRRISQS